jgi:hypothetical protein
LTGTYSITSSWANSASYFNQKWLVTSSTYPITSSWAEKATSLPYPYLRSDTFTYNYPEAVYMSMLNGILTMSFATATGSNAGFLSSTDWTKFNNKQNGLATGSKYPITASWAITASLAIIAELANSAAFAAYATETNIANSSTFSDIANTAGIVTDKIDGVTSITASIPTELSGARSLAIHRFGKVNIGGEELWIPFYKEIE